MLNSHKESMGANRRLNRKVRRLSHLKYIVYNRIGSKKQWKHQFSRSVVSDFFWPRGLQHARLPCPSPTPGAYSNSCPSCQWYHPTTSSSCHSLLLPPSIFPSIRVFSNESVCHITWPKYWSFSLSVTPSNEYSGLTSFKIDWLDLLAVQGFLGVNQSSCI